MRSNGTFLSFNENNLDIFQPSNGKNDVLKNYFEVLGCLSTLTKHFITKNITAMDNIKLVDLNPNKHACRVEISDDDIIVEFL